MLSTQSKPGHRFIIVAVYIIMFVLVALYVFIANDESKPLRHIFQPGYLIPIAIYAAGALSVSYFVFRVLKQFVNTVLSFFVSLIAGIPLGLVIVGKCIELIFVD